MFELKNVDAKYGDTVVLKGVDLTLERGKITVLLGPNGCGKSTLLKVASGQISISGGSVEVDKESLANLTLGAVARKVAFLPQNRNVPNILAGKMVLHGRFPYLGFPRKYTQKDVAIAYEAMREMKITGLEKKNMLELSGGERQRVYLAMVLCQQTDAVFMDEPTTYLDIDCQMMLWELAEKLKGMGKAVVIVTHDLSYALKMADQVVVMQQGVIRAIGRNEQVIDTLEQVFGVKVRKIEEYYVIEKGGREHVL